MFAEAKIIVTYIVQSKWRGSLCALGFLSKLRLVRLNLQVETQKLLHVAHFDDITVNQLKHK